MCQTGGCVREGKKNKSGAFCPRHGVDLSRVGRFASPFHHGSSVSEYHVLYTQCRDICPRKCWGRSTGPQTEDAGCRILNPRQGMTNRKQN